ncbi:hypothetical protein OPT61_g9006 [Boeremia exigua]|uniref:Uncharacterized protein n=1 Tax=Boeremia exigua TaxID=749465 RepID=A0ACC2HWQ9_9PLEO|nr:hypothetical protein OPT61_g9006 [Boeremia exigua]
MFNHISNITSLPLYFTGAALVCHDSIADTKHDSIYEQLGGTMALTIDISVVCPRKWNNAVNYTGVMWAAQAAGTIFKAQGHGNLIITASVSAIFVDIPQT